MLNVSTCQGCGQSDDHPKHRIAAGRSEGATQTCFHYDCHADCPTCAAFVAGQGELRGDEFRAYLAECTAARAYLAETGGAEFDQNGLLIEGSLTNG